MTVSFRRSTRRENDQALDANVTADLGFVDLFT